MGSPGRRRRGSAWHLAIFLTSVAINFSGIVSAPSSAFGVFAGRCSSLYFSRLAAEGRKPATMLRRRQFQSRKLQLHRWRVGRAADATGTPVPASVTGGFEFKMYPDDYQPGVFDPAIKFFASLTPEQGEAIEKLYFLVPFVLTVISAKTNYDIWIEKKAEEDEVRRQKIRRAINPEGWREELFTEDEMKKQRKEQEEKGKTSPKVREVLGEIYGSQVDETDGLEDDFNVKRETRAGRARRAKKRTS